MGRHRLPSVLDKVRTVMAPEEISPGREGNVRQVFIEHIAGNVAGEERLPQVPDEAFHLDGVGRTQIRLDSVGRLGHHLLVDVRDHDASGGKNFDSCERVRPPERRPCHGRRCPPEDRRSTDLPGPLIGLTLPHPELASLQHLKSVVFREVRMKSSQSSGVSRGQCWSTRNRRAVRGVPSRRHSCIGA